MTTQKFTSTILTYIVIIYNEEYIDDSDGFDYSNEEYSDEKIQMMKIECINLFSEKAWEQISIHPKIRKNFFRKVSQMFAFQALQVPLLELES